MSKQVELNWVSVQADSLSGDLAKAYERMSKEREAFKALLIAKARKDKALAADETLAVAFKAWGFSIAKTKAKGARAKADASDLFAAL